MTDPIDWATLTDEQKQSVFNEMIAEFYGRPILLEDSGDSLNAVRSLNRDALDLNDIRAWLRRRGYAGFSVDFHPYDWCTVVVEPKEQR